MTLVTVAAAALRRHPASVGTSLALTSLWISLAGAAVPLAMLTWATLWLLALEGWYAFEPILLGLAGCREPTPPEQARLQLGLGDSILGVRIDPDDAVWVEPGLRTVIVSRGALETFDDGGLAGMLAQAVVRLRCAAAAGELLVWIVAAPLLLLDWATRWLVHVGRLLAVEVGTALVLPILLVPDGFVRVGGLVLGSMLVLLASTLLLGGGLTAWGLGLLFAWPLVAGLRALLLWETRRVEAAADRVVVANGSGRHLLDALELLLRTQPSPPPTSLLARLLGSRSPIDQRVLHLWRCMNSRQPV